MYHTMSHFLKLSKTVINFHKITVVKIYPDSFKIWVDNDHYSSGFLFAGTGFMFGENAHSYYISKTETPEDYNVVKKWIYGDTNEIEETKIN